MNAESLKDLVANGTILKNDNLICFPLSAQKLCVENTKNKQEN